MLNIPLPWEYLETGNPEILAAYLEIVNSVAKILLPIRGDDIRSEDQPLLDALLDTFADDSFEEFEILLEAYNKVVRSSGGPSNGLFATLGNAIARRAIYTAALKSDEAALERILISTTSINIDVTLAALDCLPDAWEHITSVDTLNRIAKAYITLLGVTKSSEVSAVTLSNLKTLLDRIVAAGNAKAGGDGKTFAYLDVASIRFACRTSMDTPSLSNSQLAMGGFVLWQILLRSK